MSKNNDLLRAEDINKSFGAVTAAKDINVGIKNERLWYKKKQLIIMFKNV